MSCRLVDLDPRWVTFNNWVGDSFWYGVNFLCPHCGEVFVGVQFKNPIDPSNYIGRGLVDWPRYMAAQEKQKFWERQGETFATLTLTPSIDCSAHGHWHGQILVGVLDGNVLTEDEWKSHGYLGRSIHSGEAG